MRRRVCLPVSAAACLRPERFPLKPAARAMLLGIALLSAGHAGVVHAQVAAQRYDLAAGSLEDALTAFSRQAGITLSFRSELVAGKTAPALQGSYGVAEGLNLLLQGSGLEAVRDAGGSWSLRPLPAAADGATVLAAVKIVAATAGANGSADQGYRSEAVSQVGPWQGRALQDTPYSITVISKELIENLQASSPDQIYRVNPTTQLYRAQRENDQPSISMRGFTVATAYSDGLLADQYGHGTTTEDAEQIEIFTGLSGFLYGPGNVGGMINYVTKRPTAERLNRVAVGNNSGSNYYVHGDFGGPIDDGGRFGYRVNAVAQDGDTMVDGQEIRKLFVSSAFDWHVSDRLLLQANAVKRQYEPTGQAGWMFGSGVTRPSASSLDPTQHWGQKWAQAKYDSTKYDLRARWAATDSLTVRAAWLGNRSVRDTVFVRNTIQSDGTYDQTVFNLYGPDTDPTSSTQKDASGYLFADWTVTTGPLSHKLTTGIQHRQQRQFRPSVGAPGVVFNDLSLADGPVYVDRPEVAPLDRGVEVKVADYHTRNIMIGDDIGLGEHWSALLGVAHSVIDVGEITGPIFPGAGYRDSAVTPSASLIYKPMPALSLYGSYIEALERGGQAAEQFNGSPVVNAGQVMKPLISEQVEVGAKATVGSVLLTGALFQIDKGLQFYDLTTPTAPLFVQDGRQVHRGIELTLVGKASEHLTLIGGLTQLDARIREQKQTPALEGKRPQLVAETMLKLRTEYRIPALPALTLVAGLQYTGDQFADTMNADRLASYTLLDAGARYATTVSGLPLTLRLEANNAGDKRYWTNGSVVGDPRVVAFSASVEF